MSVIVGTFVKTPNEKKDYTVDWSADLATGETISSSDFEVVGSPASLTLSGETNDNTTATVLTEGGDAGEKYQIRNTVTTSQGNVIESIIEVRVQFLVLGTNTYGEADAADEYFSLAQNNTWLGYAASAREGFLVRATRLLDRQEWVGSKTSSSQALKWPRSETNIDGVEDSVIPTDIQNACYELAAAIADGSEVENEQNNAQKIQSLKAGSVALTYFRGAEGVSTRFPQIVHELVGKYLSGSSPTLVGVSTGTDGSSVTEDTFGLSRGV